MVGAAKPHPLLQHWGPLYLWWAFCLTQEENHQKLSKIPNLPTFHPCTTPKLCQWHEVRLSFCGGTSAVESVHLPMVHTFGCTTLGC